MKETGTYSSIILSFGSFFKFIKLLTRNSTPLVITWTMGNIILLMGSCFFKGPERQVTAMFHPTRFLTSVTYLGSIFLTFIVVIIVKIKSKESTPLILSITIQALMLIQLAAAEWYCLSYIPSARDIFGRVMVSDSSIDREAYQAILQTWKQGTIDHRNDEFKYALNIFQLNKKSLQNTRYTVFYIKIFS